MDLVLHRPFYGGEGEWPTGDRPFWRFFYTLAPIPAIAIGVVSLLVLLLGVGNPRLSRYRKLSAYFFAVLAVGAGLITNTLLKDQWGRPRPAQIVEFEGTEEFERLLHYDPTSEGKSFPCGHATVGFFFLALVPLLTGWRRWLALTFALVFGSLIGIARMAQGGHFASDVVWAAAVMWLTTLLFYKGLRLDRSLWWQAAPGAKRPPRWLPWVTTPLVIALVVLTTTIWPYDKKIRVKMSPIPPLESLVIDFYGEGIIELESGEVFAITSFTDGHRAPKSKLRARGTFDPGSKVLRVDFEKTGFFSELNVRTVITLPPGMDLTLRAGEEVSDVILARELPEPSWQLAPQTQILRR
ncbi:phosphatase PAP2 family protein [Roseibacillus ishigakijimensis]|uniref:Phosphatase PAP2 family protein n=1 Tax=Roseibacillus ishigakijimensis TaxID=454146 RepID=A0A934RR11_9BACT|nr:phosphatase PAP2 family protein [Roseibacillus ishigakijimensis]MBK1834041.1 phosphatase PAP2 family protein [Roseibacillus ishigakijimensis]